MNKSRAVVWKTSSSFSSSSLDFVTISSWLHSAFRNWIKTRKWERSTLVQTRSTAHDDNVFCICFYQCGHNTHMHILITLASWKKAPKHTLQPALSNHVAYLYLRSKLSEVPLFQQPYIALLPLPQQTSPLLNSHNKLPPTPTILSSSSSDFMQVTLNLTSKHSYFKRRALFEV